LIQIYSLGRSAGLSRECEKKRKEKKNKISQPSPFENPTMIMLACWLFKKLKMKKNFPQIHFAALVQMPRDDHIKKN
jgi:hypothetical protein